jgi:adenylate cyclase
MIDGLVERERMREVFGRYVSPAVRDRLLAEAPRLGGELRQVTVLFADIRDFTVISGKLEPQRLVGLLNRYFATTVAAVDEYHGYVNKFIGDAVMAVFGAPLEDPEHTRRALECARQMVRRIEALNDTGEMEVRLRAGIGLHTGEVVAGNIGAPNRFEYTVIGEPVNVASRIQGLSAELGRPVLASAAVNEACDCDLEFLGAHELKGLAGPQRLYAG